MSSTSSQWVLYPLLPSLAGPGLMKRRGRAGAAGVGNFSEAVRHLYCRASGEARNTGGSPRPSRSLPRPGDRLTGQAAVVDDFWRFSWRSGLPAVHRGGCQGRSRALRAEFRRKFQAEAGVFIGQCPVPAPVCRGWRRCPRCLSQPKGWPIARAVFRAAKEAGLGANCHEGAERAHCHLIMRRPVPGGD